MSALCGWCRRELAATARADALFCGRKCRQTAFRLRRRAAVVARAATPLRFAYADPPYPGHARLYRDQPSFAGEVDHYALIRRLCSDDSLAGWALSTSAKALRWLLPLCPAEARVCAWVKPHEPSPRTYGIHNCWEPLIVVGGRQLPPGVRDWLSALPARGGGELPGRKPIAYCAWLFELLGMQPGDEIDDLFPGTGVVGASWRELSREALGDSRRPAPALSDGRRRRSTDDLSRRASMGATSAAAGSDTSPGPGHDGSSDGAGDSYIEGAS